MQPVNNEQPKKGDLEAKKRNIGEETAKALNGILEKHKGKRVVVVGVPCSGKTTILQWVPNAIDMDKALFPKLSLGEKTFALRTWQNPLTGRYEPLPYDDNDPEDVACFEESSFVLQSLAEMRLTLEPDHPLFATLIIPTDVVVYLKIDDELLKERIQSRTDKNERPQPFNFVKKIQQIIERQIMQAKAEGIIVEEFQMKKGLNDQ